MAPMFNFLMRSIAGLTLAGLAASAQPVIFYSDLESGPKNGGENNNGAYVTLYGRGFGAERAASSVTIGGGKAAAYPLWSDTKIAIQPGSAAATGSIVVHGAGGDSNGVPFIVRPGNIYFVAVNGSDSASGRPSAPWRTVLKARNTMKPGDITYARDGVAQTTDDGEGWRTCFLMRTGGKPGLPVALVAAPGAKVTIGRIGPEMALRVHNDCPGHWVFAGLILRGDSEAVVLQAGQNWRIVANDISCPNGDGPSACVETGPVSGLKLLGNTVHETGREKASALYHGVYFSTDTNHVEVGWNSIYNVRGCRGIQVHSSPIQGGGPNDPTGHNQYDIAIHDNVIHDTQCDGIIFATIDPSKGKIEVYNNLIYNAGKGPRTPENSGNWSCIYVAAGTNTGPKGGGTVEIYNNTLADCGTIQNPPWQNAANAIQLGGGNPALLVRLRNNIVYQSSGVPYLTVYDNQNVCRSLDSCPRISAANNLFFGSGPAPTGRAVRNSVSADPLFVNAKARDYRLRPESPARGKGVDSGILFDLEGARRQGSVGCDLGAYQYVGSRRE
jgi:hypothetical protein